MSQEKVKIERYLSTDSKNFGYWIMIYAKFGEGKRGRKRLINFFESSIGKLGESFQYQRYGDHRYILKLHNEKDALIFLMKLKVN
jgi:hypothetical protein